MRNARSVLLIALALSPLRAQAPALRGFTPEQAAARQALEAKLKSAPDPARIKVYLEHMSREPHHAGSPASKAVAEYTLGLLREWGYDARMETFEALLPYPTVRLLEMTAPVSFRAKLQESALPQDPDSNDREQLPLYNAYSASGDVTAPLVYVNYGVPEDYATLARLGIDVKGKIVIARYGKSWRGVKPKVAAEHGAVGCIIYSDPRDDGYFQGDAYPNGPYRPSESAQRGSVMDMSLHVGDPLSPGWASEKGSRRLTREQATTLMKIPVLPISYADAQPLLARLGGPVAPEAWRGALPLTYHLGPGAATVHLKLDFDWSTRPLYNVIASLPGSDYPDQWIIYGNHHDAWVNGANDPLSGTASLLETARALSVLKQQGWKPKRTVMFALWDGEEFGLIGSTEWVEKHAAELQQKTVAYLNSDTNSRGSLGASGSPVLEQFMAEVARDVEVPGTGKSVLESQPRRRANAPDSHPDDGKFHLGPLGAGSDYVAFAHYAGIASLNLGFGSESSAGVYHSIYDSFYWYSHFADPDFVYGKALSQVFGLSLTRLADAAVLPFEFGELAKAVRTYSNEITKEAGRQSSQLKMDEVLSQASRLAANAEAHEKLLQKSRPRWSQTPASQLAKVNEAIYQTERALLVPEGLAARPWYKNQLSAPGQYTGYGAKTLPGIREAVEAGRLDEANAAAKAVTRALQAVNERLEQANRLLEGL